MEGFIGENALGEFLLGFLETGPGVTVHAVHLKKKREGEDNEGSSQKPSNESFMLINFQCSMKGV